jgi:hypothetical protein
MRSFNFRKSYFLQQGENDMREPLPQELEEIKIKAKQLAQYVKEHYWFLGHGWSLQPVKFKDGIYLKLTKGESWNQEKSGS